MKIMHSICMGLVAAACMLLTVQADEIDDRAFIKGNVIEGVTPDSFNIVDADFKFKKLKGAYTDPWKMKKGRPFGAICSMTVKNGSFTVKKQIVLYNKANLKAAMKDPNTNWTIDAFLNDTEHKIQKDSALVVISAESKRGVVSEPRLMYVLPPKIDAITVRFAPKGNKYELYVLAIVYHAGPKPKVEFEFIYDDDGLNFDDGKLKYIPPKKYSSLPEDIADLYSELDYVKPKEATVEVFKLGRKLPTKFALPRVDIFISNGSGIGVYSLRRK